MSSLKLRKEKNCLNCGSHVEETYCPKCGQENIELKEDAWHMIIHAIADYFHFEHKFFGTLKPLLFKPGKLTVDYVAGKRASFLHPIKLYIFISIVFFIVAFSSTQVKKATTNDLKKELIENDTLKNADIEGLENALKYIPISKAQKDSIVAEAIADEKVADTTGVKKQKNNFQLGSSSFNDVKAYEKQQLSLPKDKRDNFLVNYFTKKNIEFGKNEDPFEKLKEAFLKFIPKMMFVLLPLFALILKLVYYRKKKYYYEHLIYSFHTHSAIFLLFIIFGLLGKLMHYVYNIDDILAIVGIFYISWYIYKSLRTFYGSSRWVTLIKFLFLFFTYSILLTFCIVIIAAIGVLFS